MKSYTESRNTYGVDSKNTAAANLTQGDEWMNDYHRKVLAKADWPFLHRIRSMTSYAFSSTFTAAVTDICTAADTILLETGTPVRVSSATTLPAGLSANTTYYVIFQSSTTFKLATSFANALAGTAIDITDTGTGTHTVQVQTPFQPLPYDVDLVESVSVKVGTTIYIPRNAPSRKFFDELQYGRYTSDTPEWWFSYDGKIALWPYQSNDGNEISLNCKIRVPNLNVADYTTGNIDIVTNGTTKVTGAGSPAWTTPMAGRWIRITHSNTAASSGDGEWYRIAAIESSTVLYLDRPYGGRSLTTGAAAAYIIGMMPLLPEAFHDLPELYAAWRYWSKEKDERASTFKDLLVEGESSLFSAYGVNDVSMVIDDGESAQIINPNLTVSL